MAALFFDIDDTLISGLTGTIPESALEALKKVKEQGHEIFINTGRTDLQYSRNDQKFRF